MFSLALCRSPTSLFAPVDLCVLALLPHRLSLVAVMVSRPSGRLGVRCVVGVDHWQVWEVKASDLTLSPTYTAGAGLVPDAAGRGVGARFPRFLRRRPDKCVWLWSVAAVWSVCITVSTAK